MTRRELVKTLALVALAPACKRAEAAYTCTDTSGLSFEETSTRTTFGYADASGDPKRACSLCTQWVKPKDASCGGCKILKGPVHPNGTCKSFAAKG
jgi:hypothetical protein